MPLSSKHVQLFAALALLAAVYIACGDSSSPPPTPHVDATVKVDAAPAAPPQEPTRDPTWDRDDSQVVTALPPPPRIDPRSPREKMVAACTGVKGEWLCRADLKPQTLKSGGAQQPVIPFPCTIASWDFDPANSIGCAADSNSGTSATCTGGCSGSTCPSGQGPTLTWGEIFVHRLGGGMPQLQQATVFHMLSAQTLNVDPIYGSFQLPDGAQTELLGTLTSVCTIPINTATVTAQVRGAPGTRWQVSNACGGAVAKMLLQDTTANTWATVDSINGGNVATISQPIPNSVVSTVGIPTLSEGSMSTNDAFTYWSRPLANLKMWTAMSPDLGSAANTSASAAWVQNVQIADSSSSATSSYSEQGVGSITVLSNVATSSRLQISALAGRANAAYLINGDATGLLSIFAGGNNAPIVFGGIERAGIATGGANPNIDGDTVLHGTLSVITGSVVVGAMFSDSAINITQGAVLRNTAVTGAGAFVWGSETVTVNPASAYWNNSGTTFALSLLTSGSLTFGSNTTGCFIAGLDAGLWTCNVPITQANIDANNGLQDPQTGARFSNSQ
jgi:hypothetical protein